jgi:hypothetical protein
MTKSEASTGGATGPKPGLGLSGRITWLIATADELCGDAEERREPLLERGEAHGLERGTAERAYDLAVEERLPPAVGIAVVAAGLGVQPLESPRPDVASASSGEPDWVDAPPGRADAQLERRFRQTFRRIRSHLEGSVTPREAFMALARDPDLEAYDY